MHISGIVTRKIRVTQHRSFVLESGIKSLGCPSFIFTTLSIRFQVRVSQFFRGKPISAPFRNAINSTYGRLRLCALTIRYPSRRCDHLRSGGCSRSYGLRLRRPLGREHLTSYRHDRRRRGILGE